MRSTARKTEGALILYIIAILVVGLILLLLQQLSINWPVIIYGSLTALSFFIVHWLLNYWDYKGDCYLFPLVSVLSVIGLILLFRLTPMHAEKQFFWLIIAQTVFILIWKTLPAYERLADYKYLYIILGLIALGSTIFFGRVIGGAKSWLVIGEWTIQPSEFVKLILVIFLASYLEAKKDLLAATTGQIWGFGVPDYRHLGPVLVMWGLTLILLVFQRDLGTALIFFTTFLVMVYIATSQPLYSIVGGGLFALGAAASYFLFSHVQIRVETWLNPWSVMETKGYQIVQSLFALGSGGIFGNGLGEGFPKLIPAVHTDFIFSALAEELGLLGSVWIIMIYLLILYRGYKLALKTPDDFGKLLAVGLTALLAIQTFIIIGGVTKLVPLTGITLPYVSYGGSSLVANYILLALLMNISHKVGGCHE